MIITNGSLNDWRTTYGSRLAFAIRSTAARWPNRLRIWASFASLWGWRTLSSMCRTGFRWNGGYWFDAITVLLLFKLSLTTVVSISILGVSVRVTMGRLIDCSVFGTRVVMKTRDAAIFAMKRKLNRHVNLSRLKFSEVKQFCGGVLKNNCDSFSDGVF